VRVESSFGAVPATDALHLLSYTRQPGAGPALRHFQRRRLRLLIRHSPHSVIDRRLRPSPVVASWEVTLSARKVVPRVRRPATGITTHSL